MNIGQPVTAAEISVTISQDDLRCLEHLLNIGQFVGELLEHQECTVMARPPVQQVQLTSLLSMMTSQLNGVVERCNQQWLTLEVNA